MNYLRYHFYNYKHLYFLGFLCFLLRVIWIFWIAEHLPNALGGANWFLNPFEGPIPSAGYVSPDFNQVYDPNARMIAEGKGFSNLDGTPTAYVAPGYSFLIAIIYNLFGINIDFIRIFHAFIDSISTILIFHMSYIIFQHKQIAYLSALSYIIFPPFIYQSGLLITETLFTFSLVLYFLCALKAIDGDKRNFMLFLICGIALGISSLIRPNAIILISVFFIPIIFRNIGFKVTLNQLFFSLLGLSTVVGPWILRNYILFDQFIPISSIVFNTVEDTTGSAINILDLLYKKFYVIFTDLDYLVSFYLLAPIRIWAQTGSGTYDIYLGLINYPVIVISFLGFFKALKVNKPLSIFISISIFIFVIALIFFTKNSLTRYVVPIMPCITVFAVYYVYNFYLNRIKT
jgi:4-amino-4-deoxy-L-arabinose transferase-like glycosyltransferase